MNKFMNKITDLPLILTVLTLILVFRIAETNNFLGIQTLVGFGKNG